VRKSESVEKKFEKKPEKPESRRITTFFGGIVLNSSFSSLIFPRE